MPLVMPASSASAPSHPLQRAGTVLLASHGLPTLFGAYLVVLSGTNRADSSVVAALSMEVERKRLLPARLYVAGTVTWAAASVLLQQVLLQQVLLQQVLLLPTTCLAASPTLACVSNTRNDSFWDHTRCRSGPGTNACCATVWSPTNAAECCKNCRSSAFGFECMAWEWDAAGAACYVCSNEVLPFRGNMSGHTTGVLNLTAAAALPHSGAPLLRSPPLPRTIDQVFPPPPGGWKTPNWTPTYSTPDSTLLQACDYRWDMSRDPDWDTVLRKYGIVSGTARSPARPPHVVSWCTHHYNVCF
jgi:hypothetical protein